MTHERPDDELAELAEIADAEDAARDADPTGVAAIEEGVSFAPPDAPAASQAYGTTAAEQRAGGSLDRRLAEEEPEVGAAPRTRDDTDGSDIDAEDDALRVVDGPDRLPGATDDPVDHYVEEEDAADDLGRDTDA